MIPELIQMLAFAAPMCSALFSAVFCLMYYLSYPEKKRIKHVLVMTIGFTSAVFCWLGAILLVSNPTAFVWYNTFFFLILMFNQVFLFHVVFLLTETGGKNKFSSFHYIIPLLITTLIGIWSAFIPFEVKLFIAENTMTGHPDYPVFSMVFSSSLFIFFFYIIFYVTRGFWRVAQYRDVIVNYSADTDRISMRWLHTFLILILLNIPLPLSVIFFDISVLVGAKFTLVCTFIPIVQYVIIVYNIITGNYVIIELPVNDKNSITDKTPPIDPKRFEMYIKKEKPYLNPKLKITDLAAGLCTNRSYASAFINKEYGMNFSRYINRLRLAELDRLRTAPESKKYTNMELVLMAGFSSYRSYLRTKDEEDKRKILKIFE